MKELISRDSKINFMGVRHVCIVISLLLFAGALWVWFQQGMTKYGTDFVGGHEFLASFTGEFDSEKVRAGLASQKVEDARVQAFQGSKNEFSIRLSEVGDIQQVRSKVEGALKGAFGDAAKIEKTDYVGPTVGAELRRSALIAVGLSLIGILLYIAVRFEFAVGLGSVVALFHDVVIATGVYLVSGHMINMATLAAVLTIVGYSVNDTVVVFDRVREERAKRSSYELKALINEALNFTLSRTVITHLLTFFSALALYLLAGGEIKDLSLYLCAGIILGSYSTIFIVSAVVLWWEGIHGRAVVGAKSTKRAA